MSETALQQVNDLWEVSEFMEDKELTVALEFIAKIILNPDIPPQVILPELMKMQGIAAKLALRASWLTNVDKSNRAKKNIYYTAAEQVDKLCQTLKYALR